MYNGLVSVCPSAGYYQEKVFEVIDEVLDRYDIDGFFFNWFGFNEIDYSGRYRGVSQNPASKSGFAEFSGGLDLPTGPESPNYDLWRRYSAGVIRDLTERINAHIRDRRPNVGLIRSDIVFYEANNEVGRELWHHATGEAVSAFRSRDPERPVVVNSVVFLDMPYRLAGEQPQHFAQYLLQAMARGANPSTYIMGVPGEIPYAALESAGEIIRFHRDHRTVYTDLVPGARVGLVRPDRLAQVLARLEESTQEFRGLYAALQQAHIAFDVLPAEGLAEMSARGGLDRYRLLVIPDMDALPADVITALDTFVGDGGQVALTGRSGFDDTGRALLAATPATRILAVDSDAEQLKSTYVTAAGQQADGVRYGAALVPVFGAHYDIELSGDADSRGAHLAHAPFGPPEKSYGNRPDGQPGYVVGAPAANAGGRVGVVPWTVGRSFHELGLTTIRDTFLDLVHELAGDDLGVTAELPEQAEITVQRRDDLVVVHVLNLSGARRKSFGPEIGITGGRLSIPVSQGRVTARSLVTGSELPVEHDGGRLVVTLPKIGLFDVITIAAKETA
nr:beta-galactosidase trimerization domain-containing protein [Mycobacterium sp. MS1601]